MLDSNFFSLQGHLNIACQVVDLTAICADILVGDVVQWLCNINAGELYVPSGILINCICQDLKSSHFFYPHLPLMDLGCMACIFNRSGSS